jgi:hypothetical protein
MAYIGNQVSSVPFIIDTFSGTGSATVFGQLTRAPAGVASIAVFISGVYKTPGVDYTLNGDLILFTTPPALGTNNIVIHHMGNGSATSVPSDGSVTGAKLSSNVVRSNNIVAGSLTSNLIAVGAITGNLIPAGAISPNHIVTGSITGNLYGLKSVTGNVIGISAITSNLINVGAVTGNTIGVFAVSGNQIGLGAISSNHFAGGGVTSDVLSSNLTVSTARVAETINVVTSTVQGNYNVHVSNSTVYNFIANTTGNLTFNLVANVALPGSTTGRVNDLISIGQSVSVALMVKQGTTRYRANLYIDGVLQTAYWAGNTQPLFQVSPAGQGIIDVYNFSVIKIGTNAYDVFASNTQFGQANGQGMGPVNAPFGPRQ